MVLPPFKTPESEFHSSIAIDASNVGSTTITVAVLSSRSQEPDILESIYEHGSEIGFKPFYNKANDYEYEDRKGFCHQLLQANNDRLAVFAHNDSEEATTNLQQIEAVHSAIHVHDFMSAADEPLVIIDGDVNKARPFIKAISGLRTTPPPTVHCLQSERYYPSALLADLSASYLAHAINDGHYDWSDPACRVGYAKQDRSDDWGRAFNGLFGNDIQYTPAQLPNQMGNSVRERICCWYDGAVAPHQGSDPPVTDSINPVIQALRHGGFDELADQLAEL